MLQKYILSTLFIFSISTPAFAEMPVVENSNHEIMLSSTDKNLAANKRLVYDFWREVLEGGHLEFATKYLDESYIQHNPNVPTGRAGFVEYFSKFRKPKDIATRIKAPIVSIIAEGDLVALSFVREEDEPKDKTKKYTTTWFDTFRIKDGKIVEHWDSDIKE